MKQRKHPIIFIALLAIVTIFSSIFLSSSFLTSHTIAADGLQYCPGLAKEKNNTIDVIVTGDSESYTTFSPLELWKTYGITSYTAGKSGGKISEVRDILDEAFLHQSPKVVLLETNTLFRKKACKGSEQEAVLADELYKLFPSLKYHNIWKNLFVKSSASQSKGFDMNAAIQPYTGKIEGTVETGNVITDETKMYLQEIEDMCQKHNTTLVLYSAPSPKNYTPDKISQLESLANQMHLAYINLNEEQAVMNINWSTDTRDAGDHLNANGGVKTTAFLGKYLKENFNLPDRSKTAIAESWNKALSVYETAMNKNNIHADTADADTVKPQA